MAAALIAPRHHPIPALVGVPPRGAAPVDERAARAAVYRRRRIAAALALVVALWSAFAVASWAVAAVGTAVTTVTAGEPASSAPSQVHTVQPGDSLWSIARSIRPEGDVRPIVDELAARTGGAPLQPGQRIDVDGLG